MNMVKESVECYSTAGRGTEHFVAKELKNLGCIEEIRVTDGKVFYNVCPQNLACLRLLRCVERIFLQVTRGKTKEMCNGFRLAVEKLDHHLIRRDLWAQCVDHYQLWKKQTAVEFEESPCKRRRLDSHESQCDPIKNLTFRISCKCSGRISRQCIPHELSCRIGRKLSHLMGWQIDLRHPDMEVSVHINDDKFTVGIPMVREPLSRRPYIRHHGLRSPVAWIMCSLADIQPGSLILDPLCGKATILVEGSQNWKEALFVGVDKSEDQLKMASENVAASRTTSVTLIQANVNSLPLTCNSADAVVCDLPFGQKHIVVGEMKHFYQTTLTQIDRVIKPGGQIVLLTSCQMEKVLLQQIDQAEGVCSRGDNCVPTTDHNRATGNEISSVPLQSAESTADVTQHDERMTTVGDRNNTASSEPSGSGQEKCLSDHRCSDEDDESKKIQSKNFSDGFKTMNVDSNIENIGSSNESYLEIRNKKPNQQDICKIKGYSSVITSNDGNTCVTVGDSVKLQWTVGESYYIKLGKTHSKICTFHKKLL